MYKDKGHIKVSNGKKFKYVSYLRDGNNLFFTTSSKSNKYQAFIKENKMTVLEGDNEVIYDITIFEDDAYVDQKFQELKTAKAIPFFIPRKNKIIVQFTISE